MTEPNKTLLADEDVPTITLDGKAWPVPRLAIKQNKRVAPLIAKRSKDIERLGPENLGALTEELMEDVSTIIFLGLQRGHKDLTREEFEDMPISPKELLGAFWTVAKQSYMFKPQSTEVNGVVSDPLGAAALSPPTGTP